MSDATINIARDFTRTPGARYRSDGPFSGEEFREDKLEPLFNNADIETIRVELDGTRGYATSFLEEAFGGIARKYGVAQCQERLRIVSDEDALLAEEIQGYIRDAV